MPGLEEPATNVQRDGFGPNFEVHVSLIVPIVWGFYAELSIGGCVAVLPYIDGDDSEFRAQPAAATSLEIGYRW